MGRKSNGWEDAPWTRLTPDKDRDRIAESREAIRESMEVLRNAPDVKPYSSKPTRETTDQSGD